MAFLRRLSITEARVAIVIAFLMATLSLLASTPRASAAEPGLDGLALRGIGPAVMGGRIADIAVDPRRASTWYLAVGSGGVWKTENAGTTWTPLFDDQPSYSIGCVTLDPNRPDVVWVGTGENVSGRHVGWGDGVYKSLDGGKSWRQMGLERSEHIGDIVVDPRNSDVVWVAAEGPLWSSGGQRGLFKTIDGGATWQQVLDLGPDTGVTDLAIDPRDPDTIYAASYQRRRRVWAFLAGGPGSGIHKSTDGGATWRRLESGLPKGDIGKIGLAVSPKNPDVVYATIEAGEKETGFYRSLDRGESWQHRSPYTSGGTGPHYYQEIVASPHDVDAVYQMDVFLHRTTDGGATFAVLGNGREKHSDNHALWIDPSDPQHLLAGTDGGLYETFDHAATWRHFGNLPISQFYKVAVDDREPFYDVMVGAQDLGTLLGPSRTTNEEGVRNQDWSIPMGADGYACAFDREHPDLLYLQWQVGNLFRYDRRTDEAIDIQPQPAPGDPPERWNWDAPIVTSHHSPTRLYYASQRLWRSDDRGSSWRALSGDLTRGGNRYELEVAETVPGASALYDHAAMSWYATATSISESPLDEELVYVGTDDGLIQVLEGGAWRQASPPPVPDRSFVQEVTASLHDPDTVFAALDAHKIGTYRPFLFESNDRGRTWRSIGDGLPERTLVWSVVQDHEQKDLLFAGTEFGLYVTLDRGATWQPLKSGIPTIALRDLEIQRRESDLVAASFGRGVFVLDDYAPLRHLAEARSEGRFLFPVRDADLYIPEVPMQASGQPSQGSTAFAAANPPFGALLTYWLGDDVQAPRAVREATEASLRQKGQDVPFVGWDRLRDEARDREPAAFVTLRDQNGQAIRRLRGPVTAGLHRLAWDLRLAPPDPVDLTTPGFRPPWVTDPKGPLVSPGTYQAQLSIVSADGTVEDVGAPQTFRVVAARPPTLPVADESAVADFGAATREVVRRAQAAAGRIGEAEDRLRHLVRALEDTPALPAELFVTLRTLETDLAALAERLTGDPIRGGYDEPTEPSILGRAQRVAGGHWDTLQPPTTTQRESLSIAERDLEALEAELETFFEVDLAAFEAEVERAGAPWTPGRTP